jgi:hypothetical protein
MYIPTMFEPNHMEGILRSQQYAMQCIDHHLLIQATSSASEYSTLRPVSSYIPSSLPSDPSHRLSPTQQVESLYKYNYPVHPNPHRNGLSSWLLSLGLSNFELGRLFLGLTLGMLGRLLLGLGSSGLPLILSFLYEIR